MKSWQGFIAFVLLLLLAIPVHAQDATPTPTGNEAVDQLITILEDPVSRDQFLARLRTLSSEPQTTAPAATGAEMPAVPDADAPAPGLIDVLTQWATRIAENLPTTTFGVGIDQKAAQAWAQVDARVENGIQSGQLASFASWAVPFMLIVVAAAAIARRLTNRLAPLTMPAQKRRLSGVLVLKITIYIGLFLLTAFVVASVSDVESSRLVFLTLVAGILLAIMATDLIISGLGFLTRQRGVRFVRYCQRRFYKWWLTIALLSLSAGLCSDPELRRVIGWATADLAAFALNLTAALVTTSFVIRHRLAMGKLIFGSAIKHASGGSAFTKAMRLLARYWHFFAFVFLALSIVSLVAGQRNNDVFSQIFGSFITVLLALALSFLLRQVLSSRLLLNRGPRGAVPRALVTSLLNMLRILGEIVLFAAALTTIAAIWGFDAWTWLRGDGRYVTGPLFAVAVCAIIAWLIWVALDAWIASALTPTDAFGRPRRRSNRAQTLLPLVRNGLMILLIVLTAIAVLANIGVDVTPFIAGAGVFGLAISFGSQQLVQDVITGVFILAEDTISIGDTINTGDRSGVVESISLRTVRLRDADGALHSIPFSTIKALKNSSRNYGVFRPRYAVPSTVDPEQVMETMRETVKDMRADTKYSGAIQGDFQGLGIEEINAGSVVVSGALRTQPSRQADMVRSFNRRFLAGLAARGIAL